MTVRVSRVATLTPSVFKRYYVRRDDVQADALAQQETYLRRKRVTTPTTVAIRREGQK